MTGEAEGLGLFVDEAGQVFGGGVVVDQVGVLAEGLDGLGEGVVAAQDHAMVQILIDPGLHAAADVAKVGDHSHFVERVGGQADFDASVVAVRLVCRCGGGCGRGMVGLRRRRAPTRGAATGPAAVGERVAALTVGLESWRLHCADA